MSPAIAQQPPRPAPPDTEIYLAPLTMSADSVQVGTPVNITSSPGYDNQPAFTQDGASILFTSARGGGQTDIYRYDIGSSRVTQVTSTPESEYSPTETPDGGLSVVRVERDGTQRLWRFTLEGREPRVILESIKPVGYHAWADDHTIALFVLGSAENKQPSTLQLADTRTGTARQLAADIGRSLLRIPGGRTISFAQRDGDASLIKELDPATGGIRLLTSAVPGSGDVDCAWGPGGLLLMARGDRLYAWRRDLAVKEPMRWTEATSLERLGLHGVTRLAISPKGDRIALVGTP
jgi:hypothetical protein